MRKIRESEWARLREFQWLIITVVICVTVVIGIVLLQPDPASPPLPLSPEIACLQGGGEWRAGSTTGGLAPAYPHCYHP